jgi:hypothetical protein
MELERGMWRGKWLANGEWVIGWKVIRPEVISVDQMTYIFCYEVNPDGKYEFQPYEVDPSTLGEWTGKTVKTGPVFQDDIGLCEDGMFVVKWDEEMAAFVMHLYDNLYSPCGEVLYLEEMYDDSKIVGNMIDNKDIWDNPDLLEVK